MGNVASGASVMSLLPAAPRHTALQRRTPQSWFSGPCRLLTFSLADKTVPLFAIIWVSSEFSHFSSEMQRSHAGVLVQYDMGASAGVPGSSPS